MVPAILKSLVRIAGTVKYLGNVNQPAFVEIARTKPFADTTGCDINRITSRTAGSVTIDKLAVIVMGIRRSRQTELFEMGIRIESSKAMIEMTTNSSIRVKPLMILVVFLFIITAHIWKPELAYIHKLIIQAIPLFVKGNIH